MRYVKLFNKYFPYSLIFCIVTISTISLPGISDASFVGNSQLPNTSSLNRGLVGWWTFDGKTTLRAAAEESSGNAKTGFNRNIATSTFYTNGKIGQAFRFDGVDDYVFVPNSSGAPYNFGTGSFSVSLWARPDDYPVSETNAQGYFIDKIEADTSKGWALFLWDNGKASFYMRQGVNETFNFNTSQPLKLSQWTLFTVVVNRSSNLAIIYRDGVQDNTWDISAFSDVDTANNFFFGLRGNNGTVSKFKGTLDDIRIYNRALSPTEVTELYQQGSGTKQNVSGTSFASAIKPGLSAWWTFDGSDVNWATNKISDRMTNSNVGTMTLFSTTSSIVTGRLGQALSFNGSTQYIPTTNNVSTLLTSATGTMSVWFNARGTQTSGCSSGDMSALMEDGTAGGGFVWLGYDGTNVCAGGFDGASRAVSAAASQGVWNHAVWVHQNSVLSLWLNGDFAGATAVGNISDLTHPIHIGRSFSNGYFKGYIDDARVYNIPLSTSTIRQLYNSGASKINISQSSNNSTNLNKGLVGYWTFDGPDTLSGRVRDRSGNNNHGYLISLATSSVYAFGKIGQAFNFTGANSQYVSIFNSSTINNLGQITAAAWIYPKSFTGNSVTARIFDKDHIGGTPSGWTFNLNNSDVTSSFEFFVRYDTPLNVCAVSNSVSLNKWQHIAATWDGTKNTSGVKLYVNGVQVSNGPAGCVTNAVGTRSNDSTLDLIIGETGGATNRPFNGIIDDARLYNRVLSDAEIMQIYNGGR